MPRGLGLLFWALVIAVAALSSVAFFADRVQRGLEDQGAATLAADLVVEQGRKIPATWIERARRQGLRHSQVMSFPSVIFVRGSPQLVQVKAVDEAYPLRGELLVRTAEADYAHFAKMGHAAAEQRLFDLLGAENEVLEIPFGDLNLSLDGVVVEEPDPGASLFQLAPRLLINIKDAHDSGLLGPASRAKYRLLLAGDRTQVAAYRQWLKARLPSGAEMLTIDNGRPELVSALQRAERFLGLAALCASMLAGVGILLATRHFVQGVFDEAAILRTLGMSSARVLWRYLRRLMWVTLFAALFGVLVGFVMQQGLVVLVAAWFAEDLPMPSWQPLPLSLLHALILVLGFALPSLLAIRDVPPLRVLRREMEPAGVSQWLSILVALMAFFALMWWQADDLKLAFAVGSGLLAALLVFAFAARILLFLIRPLRKRAAGIAFGLASLSRDAGLTLVQLAGYGLSITLLLLLALVRVDLMQTWNDSLPVDAPNHFLLNIQPNEVEDVSLLLSRYGVQGSGLYPTTRARLKLINQQPVKPQAYSSSRARRLASREYSLGFGEAMQEDNRLLSGQWWGKNDNAFSVEEGVAKELGLKIGDILTFDVAGQALSAPLTSIRQVSWDSFNVNFFVQGSPALLGSVPYAVITSIYLPEGKEAVLGEVASKFPAVSAINLVPLLKKVRGIIERGALAIEGVFLFTLAAAVLVGLAAVQISREQRGREIALMRALGASRHRVLATVLGEFVLLGGLAGILASALANALSVILAEYLFNLQTGFSPMLWLFGVLGGSLAVGTIGYLASRKVLRTPPLQLMR